jgi:lysophospholipase L1-like esterase
VTRNTMGVASIQPMGRRTFMTISAAAAWLGATRMGRADEEKDKKLTGKRPKVLLLGDSIRLSYQPLVAKKLDARAEVVGPRENCRFSAYTLSSLDRWIKQLGEPAVVHWNNGLHDLGRNSDRTPIQVPVETYVANLEAILRRLMAVTPHVVWATTTPVQSDEAVRTGSWSFRNEDVVRYNKAALAVMQKKAVAVNDFYAAIHADRGKYYSADKIHLNPAGQETCANAVVKMITKFL